MINYQATNSAIMSKLQYGIVQCLVPAGIMIGMLHLHVPSKCTNCSCPDEDQRLMCRCYCQSWHLYWPGMRHVLACNQG